MNGSKPPTFGVTFGEPVDIGSQVFAYGAPPAEPRPWDITIPMPLPETPGAAPFPFVLPPCRMCSGQAFVFGPRGREPCGACRKEWREEWLKEVDYNRTEILRLDLVEIDFKVAQGDLARLRLTVRDRRRLQRKCNQLLRKLRAKGSL